MVIKPELKEKELIKVDNKSTNGDEAESFKIIEKADEEQVLVELKGSFLDEFVYEFEQNGKTVTGLSLAGVRETVRHMNKNNMARICISEREPKVRESDDWIEVWVYAKDNLSGNGAWGIKRQQKKYISGRVNEFAMEQALSKAQRNAQRALIPENYVKEMIKKFKDQGKSRKLTEGKDDNKSKKLVTEKQLKRFYTIVKGAGFNIDKVDKWVKETYKVKHKKDLTMAQIDEIFEGLEEKIKGKEEDEQIIDEFEKSEGKLKV